MKRHVMVAVPTYTGNVRVETMACILQASRECDRLGYHFSLKIQSGNAMISLVRNRFVAAVVNDPEVTDLFFIDADISWEEGAFTRMLEHPVDLVAGVYPKREDPIQFPFRPLAGDALIDNNGLVEVEGVPAGFMRIRADALRDMVQHYYHLRHEDKVSRNGMAWALFDFQMVQGRYWGEDFVFCRRWRDMGRKIYVDPMLTFAHIGDKAFVGSLYSQMVDKEPTNVVTLPAPEANRHG